MTETSCWSCNSGLWVTEQFTLQNERETLSSGQATAKRIHMWSVEQMASTDVAAAATCEHVSVTKTPLWQIKANTQGNGTHNLLGTVKNTVFITFLN